MPSLRWAAVALALLLASGCIADPAPKLNARSETREVPQSETYPGIVVRGTLYGDEALHIDATARNEGNRSYDVETNCGSPWSQELSRDGEPVELREPQVRCLAFSLTEFGPGAQRWYNVTWDGTIWDAETEEQVNAPPGEYVWSVRFAAYQQEGVALKRFDLDFPVTVG